MGRIRPPVPGGDRKGGPEPLGGSIVGAAWPTVRVLAGYFGVSQFPTTATQGNLQAFLKFVYDWAYGRHP